MACLRLLVAYSRLVPLLYRNESSSLIIKFKRGAIWLEFW